MTKWFLVLSFDYREETEEELVEWLKKEGHRHWEGIPGIVSVRIFMRSMGLGQRPTFQVWLEIPDFSFLDEWKTKPRVLEAADYLFPLVRGFNASIIKEI